MTRRTFLQLGGAAVLAVSSSRWRAKSLPLSDSGLPDLEHGPPLLGLATSLAEEQDYAPEIRGALPDRLRGTLYRNGPGRFDRGGLRKRNLLDGDGLVQAFRFQPDGRVRFQSRFVQTAKYRDEEAAGRFLYATWTTQAPGGVLTNLFGQYLRNQAGVTVVARDGRLYAFDESTEPYELDPATLETIGLSDLGAGATAVFAAHSKVDARTGEWIHFGLAYGRRLDVQVTTFRRDGSLKSHRVLTLPRYVYIHDFFVTERHILFNLHPAEISLAPFLFGQRSLVDSIAWRPEEGNLLLILERDRDTAPFTIGTDAVWMWHGLNAYERGSEIVADFVGYDAPDHFLGRNPQFATIMAGREGEARCPGQVRRYVIDVAARRVRAEIVDAGRHEYPFLNPRDACHQHRVGYFATSLDGDPYFRGIGALDMDTGRADGYRFDADLYCGEPVFAAEPGTPTVGPRDPGWLLTEVYDRRAKASFLAVLRADRVADGPIATIHLRHHVPISLHGCWQAAA